MDQLARDDIAAAAAAHRELGREYDGAVAEGLIERIGEEIDKRVDARLGQRSERLGQVGDQPAPRGDQPAKRSMGGQPSSAARPSSEVIVLGLGSMVIGGLTAALLLRSPNGNAVVAVALIWLVIGVINVAYARRR